MKKQSSSEIRKLWLDFFAHKGHYVVPSASLIPIDDDSLLWINSGVATLKKYFSGSEKPPSPRLTNSQKSIRTGDIESVGKTTSHHTMFEMLGSFSIGDYFKKEAIEFAYELLTSKKWLSIPLEKLFFTVFDEDQETYKKWIEIGVPKEKIFKMKRDTNFWDMGQGPSGPSTEIFVDKGEIFDPRSAKELIEADLENDRYVEIWNIVFSELNNDGQGNYTKLPQRNIDTGAGLERIVSILQNVPTNFETDLFKPIIEKIQEFTSKKYLWDYIPLKLKEESITQFNINAKFKAIADFIRSATFAIADGALPGPNGRGYVIRRLLRKAHIYAHGLNINESFLYKLSPIVSSIMKDFYPEVEQNLDKVVQIIKKEEDQFLNTISSAMKEFKKLSLNNELIPENAFKLYETYGLPLDFVYELAKQKGIEVDEKKVNDLMNDFKIKSRDNQKKIKGMSIQNEIFRGIKATEFNGYDSVEESSKIIALEGNYIALDKTPFYATSGGQQFDTGTLNGFNVISVEKNADNVFIHELQNHNFKIGDIVKAIVNKDRRHSLVLNHSATHLLFSALEKVWKTQIPQVGSKVEEKFLRFDFIYQGNVKDKDIKEAERIANEWIKDATNSKIFEINLDEAKKMGAAYLEGTKYGEVVRVVKLNDTVIDLCGGIHVKNTKEIEKILVTNVVKKGSGVYRLEAVSGNEIVKKRLTDLNSSFLTKKLENIIAKMNESKGKIQYFNLKDNKLLEAFINIKNLPKQDIKFKDNLNKLILIFEKIIDKINEEAEDELVNKIDGLLASDDKVITLDTNGLNIKEVNRTSLNKMGSVKGKLLVNYLIDSKKRKGTIAFILSKNLINSKLIEKIKFESSKNNLRGNGNNQMYVFGGMDISVRNMLKNIKKIL